MGKGLDGFFSLLLVGFFCVCVWFLVLFSFLFSLSQNSISSET